MKTWFEMKALADSTAEISIFDEIGYWGITAKDFSESLKKLGKIDNLVLNLSSPGGSCFDGIAIYNILNSLPAKKTVNIVGLAASMGSVIAMIGDVINMPENTMLMIHNPWVQAGGDAEELRKSAELLDKIKTALVSAYLKNTDKTEAEISALMDAETWLTAQEASEIFKNVKVVDKIEAAAKIQAKNLKNIPASAMIWIKNEVENASNTTENTQTDKPEGVGDTTDQMSELKAEFDRGFLAGKTESAELGKKKIDELSAQLTEEKAKNERMNGALDKKQSELDKLKADYNELAAKLNRLIDGGFSFQSSDHEISWDEALAKCDGKYSDARKRYPAVYSNYMKSQSK